MCFERFDQPFDIAVASTFLLYCRLRCSSCVAMQHTCAE